MPAWVKSEKTWDKAKKEFKNSYGKKPKSNKDWAIVAEIYKRMGGAVKKNKKK